MSFYDCGRGELLARGDVSCVSNNDVYPERGSVFQCWDGRPVRAIKSQAGLMELLVGQPPMRRRVSGLFSNKVIQTGPGRGARVRLSQEGKRAPA